MRYPLAPAAFMRRALFLIFWIGPTGLASAQSTEHLSPADMAAIRSVLAEAQSRSISENREVCGLFGRNPAGKLISTKGRMGGRDGCRPGQDPPGVEVFATWHTHGAFVDDYDSEVPSPDDVEAEMDEGLIGFVATPGGRLWQIDGFSGTARLVCDLACLPHDPEFEHGVFGPVARSYTLDQLFDRASH